MDTQTPAAREAAVAALAQAPYASVDDAAAGLARLQEFFWERHDRRAVFALAYLGMTREVRDRLRERAFLDNAWVDRLVVAFANLYRRALYDFARGATAAVPRAWLMAFETAKWGHALLPQDLVLGVNAHINRDLPVALHAVGIDPDRERRYRDHTAVNAALAKLTDLLQDEMAELYVPAIHFMDRRLGRFDERMAGFTLTTARERCWRMAGALTAAPDDAERAAIIRRLDDEATRLAELILVPAVPIPLLLEVLQRLERLTPWWAHLAAAPGRPAAQAPVALPPAENLEELAARLRGLEPR